MKTIMAHKIRLYPNHEQEILFRKSCGVVRVAYNWGLARWIELYKAGEKTSAMALKKEFNAIKYDEYPWVNEVSGRCTEYGFARLGKAYQNFFRRVQQGGEEPGFPKFKKRGKHDSFYVANTQLKLKDGRVYLPKIGWVKMAEELRFQGKIMSGTISLDGERWFISIAVEVDMPDPQPLDEGEVVGVNLGTYHRAVLSNGEVYPHHPALEKHLKKLAKLNKKLARQKPGSNRREKTRKKINRLHYRIRCIRTDAIHKMTTELTQQHGTIIVEGFDVRKLMEDNELPKGSRKLGDVAIGETRRQLEYKAELNGSNFVKLPTGVATNQVCYECGAESSTKIPPHQTSWTCLNCGTEHDRGLNSARVIKKMGLQQLTDEDNGDEE